MGIKKFWNFLFEDIEDDIYPLIIIAMLGFIIGLLIS